MAQVTITHQGHLESLVRALFPGANIQQNLRKEMGILYPPTGYFLEVDLWLPDFKLAFEFQDAHHYTTTWRSHVPLGQIQKKDNMKKERLQERGQTLVTIPCWWDGSSESLIATIKKERPDLLQDYAPNCPPIDSEPPANYFSGSGIPVVGELMLPSFVASTLFNPTSWWLSEKYDGVRACWCPTLGQLYSRFGTQIYLPDPFTTQFPSKLFLDSEIWLGRGTFEDAQKLSAIRNKWEEKTIDDNESFWAHTRFIAFDDANPKSKQVPFEFRFSILLSEISRSHQFIIPTFTLLCTSKRKLVQITSFVMDHGGEGSVIRKPRSAYENGRSDSLLKFKANRMDLEALVVSPSNDSENTCTLQLPGGIIFEAPFEGENTLRAGQVVTLSFSSFSTSGKPTNPRILRVRKDREWTDIEADEKQQIHPLSVKAFHETMRRPHGYWTRDEGRNASEFLEKLAKKMERDSSQVSSWYDLSPDIITNEEGGASILSHFGGSVAKTITSSLPHLKLDPTQFTGGYWTLEKNRKKFFEDFAKKKEIDLKTVENWYSVSIKDVLSEKSAGHVLRYYGGDVISALVSLYPVLKRSKFPKKSRVVGVKHARNHSSSRRIYAGKQWRGTSPGPRQKAVRKNRKNSFLAPESSKLFRGLSNVKGMLMYIRSKISS